MSRAWPLLILAVGIAALAVRTVGLRQRPMHTDEAVHAAKFGRLLEEGEYRYDPREYHGPTLNYLTLVPARLTGANALVEVNEFTLRIVPVVCGALLVLMLLLLLDGLGRASALWAATLTAVSPAFIFYSRYYIQEMLLVFFSFGLLVCGFRYYRSRRWPWAVSAGAFAGLVHATKETSIIVFAAMGLSLLLIFLLQRKKSGRAPGRRFKWGHIAAAAAVACGVSVLFYSSFFSNPAGVLDSVRTYATYLQRAGENELHIHPCYYYLKMLVWTKVGPGPVWTEGFILLLAIVGFCAAMAGTVPIGADLRLARFIGLYTLILMVVYSAIPYKTPWCMLGFLHGMIVLAGLGAGVLIQVAAGRSRRVALLVVLAAAAVHVAWLGYITNFIYYADPRNPYVYAHTHPDIVRLAARVSRLAEVHPDGYNMHIEVICPEDDYWPLPWYLRSYEQNRSVGWYDDVDYTQPPAPLIIACGGVHNEVLKKIYERPKPGEARLYVPLFREHMYLRPGVEIRGYLCKELRDRLQQAPQFSEGQK